MIERTLDRFVISGGHVLDPSQAVDAPLDVIVGQGKIEALVPPGTASGLSVIDATDAVVTPGLIDIHAHWFGASTFGIDPEINLRGGVTTTCDAGSAGFVNFGHFRESVIERAPVNVFAFVHVGALGLPTTVVGELQDIRLARPLETAEAADRNRDIVVGIKVRLDSWASGENMDAALDLALEAAGAAQLPLMVHIGTGARLERIAPRLRPGDIVTHAYAGLRDGLIVGDEQGTVPFVSAARSRGVLLDTGLGCASWSWRAARAAMEAGLAPDTISTDLHRYSIDASTIDLPTTMSKFLHLGMSLEDVVRATTITPARAIGRDSQVGSLLPGRDADIAILRLEDGPAGLADPSGQVEHATRRIAVQATVRHGRVVEPASVRVELRQLFTSDLDVKCGGALPE